MAKRSEQLLMDLSSASEIYTSDSGRNDSEAGISEDGSDDYDAEQNRQKAGLHMKRS